MALEPLEVTSKYVAVPLFADRKVVEVIAPFPQLDRQERVVVVHDLQYRLIGIRQLSSPMLDLKLAIVAGIPHHWPIDSGKVTV